MAIRAYKTMKFNGYEISVSGSIYKRDANGSLRRIKGPEAMLVRKDFLASRKAGKV